MSGNPLNTDILTRYLDKHEPGRGGTYAVAYRSTGTDGIPGWDYQTFTASDSGHGAARALAASREDAQMFVRDQGRWRRMR